MTPRDAPSPGLHVHRSNRLDRLAGALVDRLASSAPDDVHAPFVVVVGSRGMERWLRHRIAQSIGVCANVDFRFPKSALDEVAAAILAREARIEDPWSPDALVFGVLAALPSLLEQPELAPVRRYAGSDADRAPSVDRRTYGLAREIADLFDRYVHYRRDWIAAWQRDAQPAALAADAGAAWQRRLFRALESRLAAPHAAADLAALEAALAERRAASATLAPLHVFGVSSMPPTHLEALAAVAKATRVDLYVLSPSDLYWGDVRTVAQARRALRLAPRDDAAQAIRDGLSHQNPLLTTLGRLSRDLQIVLEDLPGGYREPNPELFVDPCEGAARPTMLARLQSDVLRLASPAELRAEPDFASRALRDGDDSIRFHACHGPTRQVEVLREALLRLFDEHRELQPRDVVVMTPDVAAYAPLVSSIFGEGRDARGPDDGDGPWGAVGAPRIPVDIADLGVRQRNAVADALLRVLELVESRVAASAVVDLVALEPVRRRFGLSAQDLEVVLGWMSESGIRWGADERERARVGQPEERAFTFRFGLERLALGVAMSDEDDVFGGVAPHDAMEGEHAELYGRFSELCATLFSELDALRDARPLAAWTERLRACVDAIAATSPTTGFLREQVFDELGAIERQAAACAFETPVEIGAIRAMLEGRFDAPRGGDRPIGGAVTVCALSPMRSVPFRVVCLLGMDDGAFPRPSRGVGFDLTRVAPRVGDRDPRDEDRHLLLEAILSARDHLFVFFTGHDPKTNEPREPAVPIAELLDVLDASFPRPTGRQRVRDAVLVTHTLQPFGARNFAHDAPRSHDRRMRRAALALARERSGELGLFRDGPLPEAKIDALSIDDLAAFVRHPVRALLERRLGLRLRESDASLEDREPIELDSLGRWSIADGLLSYAMREQASPLSKLDWDRANELLVARGALPMGAAGRSAFADRRAQVEAVLAAADDVRARARAAHDVAIEIAGVRLSGTIPDVDGEGELLEVVHDDPTKPRYLLRAWVRLLALRASAPQHDFRVRIVGATKVDAVYEPQTVTLAAPADARAPLEALVELHRAGMRAPLMLFEKTSRAFAAALAKGGADPSAAVRAARKEWEDGHEMLGEGKDPYLYAVHRDAIPFLVGGEPHPEFVANARVVWAAIDDARAEGAR